MDPEEPDAADGLGPDGDRRVVAAEGGDTPTGARLPGDGADGPVEVRRRAEGVDEIRPGVDGRIGIGHVVDLEGHARGNRSDVDVGRCHADARRRQVAGHLRTAADPDLDGRLDPGKPPYEGCVGGGLHGETIKYRPHKGVRMLVDIVPVGEVTAQVKREASSALRGVLDCEVTIHGTESIPDGAYDESRDQYRAEEFIELASRVGSGDKNIAVTPADLYYRRRNYGFGLAYLDGKASVVSTYRLQTSSDGGFSNKSAREIFSDRIRKEVVHEIGHTIGLEHCDNGRCVMNFSPTVREVDRKEEHLCGSCQRALDGA